MGATAGLTLAVFSGVRGSPLGCAAAALGNRWLALGSRRRSGVCKRWQFLCAVGGSVSDPDGIGGWRRPGVAGDLDVVVLAAR